MMIDNLTKRIVEKMAEELDMIELKHVVGIIGRNEEGKETTVESVVDLIDKRITKEIMAQITTFKETYVLIEQFADVKSCVAVIKGHTRFLEVSEKMMGIIVVPAEHIKWVEAKLNDLTRKQLTDTSQS
jgi:ABC-type dipeptide/oligopeptide/nickel transport system ATPase component